MTLKWTTDAPTVAGWYWIRIGIDVRDLVPSLPVVVCLSVFTRGKRKRALSCSVGGVGKQLPLTKFAGAEWAGPIPEPGGGGE